MAQDVESHQQQLRVAQEGEAFQRNRAVAAEANAERLAYELTLLGRAMAASSNGTTIVDMRVPDMPIVFASEAFCRLTGYHADEVMGRNCRFLQGDDRGQRERGEMRAALELGRELKVTLRNYRKDGQMFYNELSLSPVRSERGELTHFVGIQNDVSVMRVTQAELERMYRLLEARVEERTQELRQANEQLESFTYSVSHDLRAPIRSLLNSARLLAQDLGPDLAPETRELLEEQVASARRLNGMMEELLRLARVRQTEITREPLDLSTIARGIAESIVPSCAAEIEPGMVAFADPILIHTILINLVSNACKFTHPGGKPQVEIGRERRGGEIVYFVRDHGRGFDPLNAERIFRPFERLHADVPGTGVGLTNARVAVQRLGGRLWAESEPDQGATFLFTLGPENRRHEEG